VGARKILGDAVVSLGEGIKPDESKPPVAPVKTPPWVVFLTIVGAVALLVLGALVLSAGRHIWENPDPPATSAKPTKFITKVVKKPGKKLSRKARRRTGRARGKAQIVRREVTVERASEGGGRSETVALATLATGAALLLAGGFAARLTSIKLPGVEMATVAAYNAGAVDGVVAAAKTATVAKETGKDDVLADEGKLVEAANLALRARIEEGGMAGGAVAAATTPATGVGDGQKLREAAEAAVQEVSED
jgi:hypothetical protein